MDDASDAVDVVDIVDHLAEGLQVIGPDFRYLYLNRVAAQHGQRRREELIGRTMAECYPGIQDTEIYRRIGRLLVEGGDDTMENEFAFPDGSTGWFELRMARVPRGVMILSIDITERKKLEAQVRRSQRMDALGQMAGGVAHDFNNILSVILAYGSFIEEDLPEGDPMREDAETLVAAAKRGADLTHRLLTFACQLPVEPSTFSVETALSEVSKMLRRAVGESVSLTLHIAADAGEVTMDPTAFDQVMVNLVVNARDAMGDDGGRITVEAEPFDLDEAWRAGRGAHLAPGRYSLITVSDTGSGMPPDVMERIFEPFFTTKGVGRGSGIGLATCWGLVEQVGGAISVYSEVGRGTTFRIYLPNAQGHVAQRTRIEPKRLDGQGERVLVVEDQAPLREIIVRVLRTAGYRAVEAARPIDAVHLLEDVGEVLDLVVSDVVMPGISGVELAQRARARRPPVPVVLLSGFTPRALERGPELAALPLLTKPFTPRQLLVAVRTALDGAGPGTGSQEN